MFQELLEASAVHHHHSGDVDIFRFHLAERIQPAIIIAFDIRVVVQGKNLGAIEQLMRDAVALDRAGVCCIVLEGIPREVAAMITAEVATPTIGIGAGPECDGQVLVFHDLLNLTFAPPAKFVRRYGDAAALIRNAVQAFAADVKSQQYPSDDESYHLPKDTKAALDTVLERKRAMQR